MKNDLGIIGESNPPTADESEHFTPCPICGQMFDMRDLAQVMHHAEPQHEPLTVEEQMRVVLADEILRSAGG